MTRTIAASRSVASWAPESAFWSVPAGRPSVGVNPSSPTLIGWSTVTDFRIHTYAAAESGIFANSYLLETADGVVLVDANLLVSDARVLAAPLPGLRHPVLAAVVPLA